MHKYQTIVDQTDLQFVSQIASHNLLEQVLRRNVNKEQYVSYLRETCHLTRHTPRFLSATASAISHTNRGLRRYFLEQAAEEDGHDLMCTHDLSRLGVDVAAALANPPGAGCQFLVSNAYYNASIGNPYANLGLASVTEMMGASIAGTVCDDLEGLPFITNSTTTFLRSHAGFDVKHLQEIEKIINECVRSTEQLNAVIHGRRMAISGYAMLFDDVLCASAVPTVTELAEEV